MGILESKRGRARISLSATAEKEKKHWKKGQGSTLSYRAARKSSIWCKLRIKRKNCFQTWIFKCAELAFVKILFSIKSFLSSEWTICLLRQKFFFLLPYQITACLCWSFRSYHDIRPTSELICFSRHSSLLKLFLAAPSGSRQMPYDNFLMQGKKGWEKRVLETVWSNR